MKRTEKLKVLQGALQGQTGQLIELKRQQSKKAAPYLEAHGIIDAYQYPPELADIIVWYGEVDGKQLQKPLHEWVNLLNEVGQIVRYGNDAAIGFIDANDSQYDAVPLSFSEIRSHNYSYWYLPECTIEDLRRYYNQSEASFKNSVIPLMFDTDMVPYDRYLKRMKEQST